MLKYRYYRFSDQDPIIGVVLKAIGNKSITSVARDAGVTAQMLYNWKKRKTRRPQFATAIAVLRALGRDIKIVKRRMI